MEKIRIKNIRSLKDTGNVPIAPLTLLVGENSSGKSTFLRTFPLLKQSIIKKTNGPILWAGDVDDYVDFGSFKETITDGKNEKMEIGFQFRTALGNGSSPYWFGEEPISKKELSQIQFSITIQGNEDREYVSALNIKIDTAKYEILFDGDKQIRITIDGEEIPETEPHAFDLDISRVSYYFWYMNRNEDIRSVFGYTLPNLSNRAINYMRKTFKGTPKNFYDDMMAFALVGKALTQGKTLSEIKEDENILYIQEECSNDTKRKIRSILNKLTTVGDDEKNIGIGACKLLFFSTIYSRIESYVDQYFRQVHYIAPLRATAERYYRLRNSAIDEVDYQGKNLAIFLNSLDHQRMERFQKWTEESFGFKATVQKNAGHLSVAISRNGFSPEINLSDTGFGYSQILPIITQLWELSTRQQTSRFGENNVVPLVVAIEQPELHLHPAMQGRLAKAFIACIELAKTNGYQLQLLLETHSKTIVDYFGRAVARHTLKVSDVAVVLFERDAKTGHTKVTKTEYDSAGALKKWPIGFFEPEE